MKGTGTHLTCGTEDSGIRETEREPNWVSRVCFSALGERK